MSAFWKALVCTMGWCCVSGIALADPLINLPRETPIDHPSGPHPSDHAVQLPPQAFDNTAKVANHTRERRGEWSISGGVYFMQPVFNTNPAFVVISPGGAGSRQVNFNHHLETAPQVWLGYVGERGWGVRARWYEFDTDSSTGLATAPGQTVRGISSFAPGLTAIGGNVYASSQFAVDVADVQATWSHDGPRWSCLAACGVRYTHMSQDYRTTLIGPATNIQLASGHNFNGAGPSFAFESKRRIGESGFSLYGNIYGALLFGNAKETQFAFNNGTPLSFVREESDVLPVGEMEIGTEYRRNAGRMRMFLQCGFTGQVWWGGGNATNLDANGSASADSRNFGLLGIALRAGLQY